MKAVELPNGFGIDLDSIRYIQSWKQQKHPWSGEPIDEAELLVQCENAQIILRGTIEQIEKCQSIILIHLNAKAYGK